MFVITLFCIYSINKLICMFVFTHRYRCMHAHTTYLIYRFTF